VAEKFHFAILRIEVTRASRGLSAIAELLVLVHLFVIAVKVVMLCLAWKLKAEQMGFFTLNEWVCGMTELQ